MLSNAGHFYRDEAAFIEGTLRMPSSGFSSGDYIHGPVIHYALLSAYVVVAAFKLLFRQIGNPDDFVRWYIEHPESLGEIGRLVMSVGGAAMIVVTMALARSIFGSRHYARLAALMLLSMPLFHHASWYIKEDLWAALFGAAAAVVAYRRRSAAWTGALWGAAIAAKYTAIALGPALLLILMERGEGDWFSWKKLSKTCAWLGLTAMFAFVALNPYTLINFGSFVNQVGIINKQYVRGDLLGAANPPPFLASRLLTEFLPFDIGLLVLVSICAGLVLSRFKPGRWQLPPVVACGAVLVMIAVSRAGFPRTLAIALPWLAILASAAYRGVLRARFSWIVIVAVLGCVVMLQTAGYYRCVTAAHTGELARAYVERSVAKDAVILMEDVHEYVSDAAPSLRNNARGLKTEHDDLLSRGAVGRLNQMRQAIANGSPAARFEILGIKDFSTEGESYLDRADVVITCKWPSVFPENRQYNLPEDSQVPAIGSYQRNRRIFLEALGGRGFQLLAKFDPTFGARWSFIDRPDPSCLSPAAWLIGRELTVGPEIAIYSRSTEVGGLTAQPGLEKTKQR
ncbi:MAG: glycosyltransferase family 39 protein [Acidobacteriota bacterium]